MPTLRGHVATAAGNCSDFSQRPTSGASLNGLEPAGRIPYNRGYM